MTQKLHIKTWGCQMNEYDSSKMADLLLNTHGLELTDIPEEADVLLLNTCSIREKAQEKSVPSVGSLERIKKQNPNLVIGVGGCVASKKVNIFVIVHLMWILYLVRKLYIAYQK